MTRATTTDGAEKPSERLRRVAEARTTFRAIKVPFAPQEDLMAALEEMRLLAEANQGGQLSAVQVLAPIGTGKTVGGQRYVAGFDAREDQAEGRKPVIFARLDTSGKASAVPTAILRALGAFRPDHGNEDLRWDRARTELRRHGTQLVIIDEIDRANRRPSVSPFIADSLRDLLDEGLVGLAFLGLPAAASMFENCPALLDRLDAPVSIGAIDWFEKEDKGMITEFAAEMDGAIHYAGLLKRKIGLAEEMLLQPLVEASDGRLRRICGILERAVCAAHVDGRRTVGRDDLAEVVDAWLVPKGLVTHNPLRNG